MSSLVKLPDFSDPDTFTNVSDEVGTTFAVYVLYFFSVPILAWILDNYKISNKFMLKLGDEGNKRYMQRKAIIRERLQTQKSLSLQCIDDFSEDEESADMSIMTVDTNTADNSGTVVTRQPLSPQKDREETEALTSFRNNKVSPDPDDTIESHSAGSSSICTPRGRKMSILRIKTVESRKKLNRKVSFITRVFGRGDRERFNDGFWKNIMNGKSYAGINSAKLGCGLCGCCATPGLCGCCVTSSFYNDFYFYICNNNIVLSMFCACPGHPFSRSHRRLAYLLQQAVAFSLTVIAASINFSPYTYTVNKSDVEVEYTVTPSQQRMGVNMFIISPFVLLAYDSIYALLACPCLKTDCQNNCLRFFKQLLERGGSMLGSVVSLLVGIVLLFVISMWPHSEYDVLWLYAIQVQSFSIVLDFIMGLLNFWPFFYCEIKLLGLLSVLKVGSWIGERRECKNKQFGSKPVREFKTCWGLIIISCSWWNATHGAIAPDSNLQILEEGPTPPTISSEKEVSSKESNAAITLQCGYRSWVAKMRRDELSILRKEEMILAEEAVIILQAHIRGAFCRRIVKKLQELPKSRSVDVIKKDIVHANKCKVSAQKEFDAWKADFITKHDRNPTIEESTTIAAYDTSRHWKLEVEHLQHELIHERQRLKYEKEMKEMEKEAKMKQKLLRENIQLESSEIGDKNNHQQEKTEVNNVNNKESTTSAEKTDTVISKEPRQVRGTVVDFGTISDSDDDEHPVEDSHHVELSDSEEFLL
jgi:hypothetical protein